MKKKQGFTLMELLLVIAILAIVAAIAAPQFFRSGEQAMKDARVALVKANYAAIKAAINMRVWDEKNNPNINSADYLENKTSGTNVKDTGSMIRLLVDKGYIQENAAYAENKQGKKIYFAVQKNTTTADNPYDTVASSPIFMEKTQQFTVRLVNENNGNLITAYASLDDALKAGKSWQEIYDLIP